MIVYAKVFGTRLNVGRFERSRGGSLRPSRQLSIFVAVTSF
jgi:hypothetical protein